MPATEKRRPLPPDADPASPRKADYRGATPRQVAEAVLRYRGPGKPVRPVRKRPKNHPDINPSIQSPSVSHPNHRRRRERRVLDTTLPSAGGSPGRYPCTGWSSPTVAPTSRGTPPSERETTLPLAAPPFSRIPTSERGNDGLPARDCWIGSDPPGRVSGMCTSQPSAMPALGIARGGSLPSTALRPGSTSAKRVAVAQPPAV